MTNDYDTTVYVGNDPVDVTVNYSMIDGVCYINRIYYWNQDNKMEPIEVSKDQFYEIKTDIEELENNMSDPNDEYGYNE